MRLRNKNKLTKDKYIATMMNINVKTIWVYKNKQEYRNRFEAYKSYYNKIIDSLTDTQLEFYAKNIKQFEKDLKDNKLK